MSGIKKLNEKGSSFILTLIKISTKAHVYISNRITENLKL